jgi:hypothetical protein
MMKNYIWTPVLAAVLLFAGCANPLDDGGARNGSGFSGLGTGTVRVTLGENQARTLLPDTDVLADLYYALQFRAEGKTAVNLALLQGASAEVELEPGTWNLDVKGYVSESDAADPENAVVTGGASVTLEAGGVTPVNVALSAKAETGAGTLVYDIRFPANAESAVLSILPITATGNRQERDLKAAALPSGDNVSRAIIEMDNLPAGYYRIGLEVSVGDGIGGILRAKKTLMAHIYNGLTTSGEEIFGADSFARVAVFSSIVDLSTWLAEAEENTKETPFQIVLRGLDLETDFTEGIDSLGKLYSALNGRYIALDLSGCTGEEIGDTALAIAAARVNKDKLVSLALPATLENLGNSAFSDCTSLTSLNWPASEAEVRIGDYAFDGCLSLTSFTLPEGLKSIGGYAFRTCKSLTALRLPAGMKDIGNYAFAGSRLTSLEWPEAPEGATTGNYTFSDCVFLVSVLLPAGLTQTGQYAFYGCTSLEKISLPVGLTRIGDYAFQNCRSLREVSLPAELTQIGSYTFQNCVSLRDIPLPAGLTQIGGYTFQNCVSLRDISLPEGLQRIASHAFRNCTSLRELTLPASLTLTNNDWTIFSGCGLESVYLPAGFTGGIISGDIFSGNPSLVFHVDPANTMYTTALSGTLLLKGTAVVFAQGAAGDFSVPEGITEILNGAFHNNTALTSITLPSTLQTIGYQAFYYCSNLRWVKWPVSAAEAKLGTGDTLGSYEFRYCSKLEKVELPDNLKTIHWNSFTDTTALRVVVLHATTPPDLHSTIAFPSSNAGFTIYVPDTTVDTYKGTTVWSSIASKIASVATLTDLPAAW